MKKLKIKTLPRSFVDRTEMLLHATFQCLVDYIEQEDPGETIDWSATPEHAAAWREIMDLYMWWTKTRPSRKDPIDNIDDSLVPPIGKMFCQEKGYYPEYKKILAESNRMEEKWDEEDQKNLHRLVEIRGHLWT